MQDSYTKILDYLFIGDKQFSKDLDKLKEVGITHIVNVTTEIRNYYEKEPMFAYFKCPVMDTESSDLSEYFEAATHFIHEARQTGHSVLVHCQQGVSRSSTIVLAYLIKYEKMKVVQAYTLLRSLRPQVRPKSNFLAQLMKFEKKLNMLPASQVESKTSASAEDSRKRKEICGPSMPSRSVGPSLPPSLASSSSSSSDLVASTSSCAASSSSADLVATRQKEESKAESSSAETVSKETGTEVPLKKARVADGSAGAAITDGDVASKDNEATVATPAITASPAALGETEFDPRESAA